MIPYFLILSSWVIVAFGHPYMSLTATFLASCIGYALFWRGIAAVKSRRSRFLAGGLWMVAVQMVQLSWMCSIKYQGIYIIFVYLGVAIWFGLQSGLFVAFFDHLSSKKDLIAFAGLWTLFEWSRLFFLSGFPFNPAGLSMSWHAYPMQLAAVGGVYFLSFWVIATNLCAYTGRYRMWIVSTVLPIIFGVVHVHYHLPNSANATEKMVTLVQPALLPDQKALFSSRPDAFVTPFKQWEEMVTSLPKEPGLIVLPEALTPFSISRAVYPLETALLLMQREWGDQWAHSLPPLEEPYAEQIGERWCVTNAFWAQAIANHYHTEVIAGFDVTSGSTSHNSAFHFTPENGKISRYDKRILVPLAEYLPLKFLQPIVANYGIVGHFTHGKVAKVFAGKSLSVCFEECYPHLMRGGKNKGATVYVNLTNDGWFAPSKLPLTHLYHARLRAVENGIPLLRTSNTGGTAVIDALGRITAITPKLYEKESLHARFSTYTYNTLYTFWGDWFVILGSFAALFACLKNAARLPFSLTQLRKRGRS